LNWITILLISLIVLIMLDLLIHLVYVRVVLRIFETKPPFSVASTPSDPQAELV